MKTIKIIICTFVLFLAHDAFSYVLVVTKTFLGHNPNGAQVDYNYTLRTETTTNSPVDPNIILKKEVDIFCEGNGVNGCPNSICVPADAANPPNFMTLSAINAAQNLLTAAVSNYMTSGSTTGSSGTIGTPDGLFYNYSIVWVSSATNGDKLTLRFESA